MNGRGRDNLPATAFEFKYDQPIPSEKIAPRTQKVALYNVWIP